VRPEWPKEVYAFEYEPTVTKFEVDISWDILLRLNGVGMVVRAAPRRRPGDNGPDSESSRDCARFRRRLIKNTNSPATSKMASMAPKIPARIPARGVPDFVDDDPTPLLNSLPVVAVPAAEDEDEDGKDCVVLVLGTPSIGCVDKVEFVVEDVVEKDAVLINEEVDDLSPTVVVITIEVVGAAWEEEEGGELPFVGS